MGLGDIMLFVSRRLPSQCFGVVDTDDGVETIVPIDELGSIVSDFGIDVKGVSIDTFPNGTKYVCEVLIQQDPTKITAQQAKFRTLYDTKVIVYNGELVGIHVGEKAKYPISINVSSFANKISSLTQFWWDDDSRVDVGIVLVFDDSVEITGGILPVGEIYGLKFDISGITDSGVANSFYHKMLEEADDMYSEIREYIEDREDRFDIWTCISLLSVLLYDSKDIDAIARKYGKGFISQRIEELLIDEFERLRGIELSGSQVKRISTSPYSELTFNTMMMRSIFSRARQSKSFEFLKKYFWDFFDLLLVLDGLDIPAIRRFMQYVKYLDCSERVQRIYIEVCNKLARDVVSAMNGGSNALH